jgi:hypothetical protein
MRWCDAPAGLQQHTYMHGMTLALTHSRATRNVVDLQCRCTPRAQVGRHKAHTRQLVSSVQPQVADLTAAAAAPCAQVRLWAGRGTAALVQKALAKMLAHALA